LGISVLQACRFSEGLQRYGHVQLSSFGCLRVAGFALVATFEHPHFTIVRRELSAITPARLLRRFNAPVAKPAYSGDV
jgi:hypothetical protein